MTKETRVLTGTLELRTGADGKPRLEGYAAVFGKLSEPLRGGTFRERIRPGAFARAIRERQDVRALVNHDANLVLGRTTAGTLELAEDAHGLRFSVLLDETTYAQDLRKNLARKDVDQASFSFRVVSGGEAWTPRGSAEDGLDVRELKDVDLFDVSACTFPAYADTSVAVRSRDEWLRTRTALGALEAADAAPGPRPTGAPVVASLEARMALGEVERTMGKTEAEGWDASHPGERRSCWASHLGVYAMEPRRLQELVALAKARLLEPAAMDDGEPRRPMTPEERQAEEDRERGYSITQEGVAVVRLSGVLKKEASKYGGTSTVVARAGLRAAAENRAVGAVLLLVDSPGGHVSGTKELADEVRRVAARKPVHAYVEDLGASAAYWVLCQAQRVTCNAMAEVGSIGVLGVVHDSSGAYERAGVKVHVVATGLHKGAGTPGAAVLPEHLADAQRQVGVLFAFFRGAVAAGRGLNEAQVDAVSDGRTWIGQEAVALGLVDEVGTYEQAVAAAARAAGGAGAGAPMPMAPSMAAVRQRQAEAEVRLSLGAGPLAPAWRAADEPPPEDKDEEEPEGDEPPEDQDPKDPPAEDEAEEDPEEEPEEEAAAEPAPGEEEDPEEEPEGDEPPEDPPAEDAPPAEDEDPEGDEGPEGELVPE